jgi:hypothetical protein
MSLASFQDIHEEVEFVAEPDNFNDSTSMLSLDAASEKLYACMERTSQSRMLMKQLSQHKKPPSVTTLCSRDSHRSFSQRGTHKSTLLCRQDSARSGLLLRSDLARIEKRQACLSSSTHKYWPPSL